MISSPYLMYVSEITFSVPRIRHHFDGFTHISVIFLSTYNRLKGLVMVPGCYHEEETGSNRRYLIYSIHCLYDSYPIRRRRAGIVL